MKLTLTFLVTFLAGPAAFWILARQTPTRGYFRTLFGVLAALIAAAFALNLWGLPAAPDHPLAGLAVILTMWLAWIVVLALCVLAVRRSASQNSLKRLAFALGAMATTLPWFGLYTAQMVAN